MDSWRTSVRQIPHGVYWSERKGYVMGRGVLGLLAGLAVLLGMTACSTGPAEVPVAGAVVIDVRTPQEYAEGHLQGATNIDVQSGSFEQQVSALETGSNYVVYCRSGNRSARAVELMTKLGFQHVVDGGGLQDAARATGLPIVTG